MDKYLQIFDLFIFPFANVVRFIITQPRSPLGTFSNVRIVNKFIDAYAKELGFNFLRIFSVLSHAIVFHQKLERFTVANSSDLI